jgi:bifunctional DNA-binding transcriptional regulator/antitoxin component of YhaV-PrlF toxin-antitoxin module
MSDEFIYEVLLQEDAETGEVILPIPLEVLEKMGWKENDQIDIQLDDTGRIIMKKL